ncbi:MAG: signal peptide peptidase SppA [Nanoarchaeota archaeon]
MKQDKNPKSKVWTIIIILFILFLVGTLMASVIAFFSDFNSENEYGGNGNVALIPLKGVLLTDDDSSFMGVQGQASSTKIVRQLEEARDNPDIQAIVLDINSPGGSGVAADEIIEAMNDIKQNKTIVAWIRDMGASAAFWVSVASNYTIADRLSMTGSIGVIGSYLEYPGLLDRFNVTYRRLVAGKYKDTGSPYREMTKEEQVLDQQKLDAMHDIFIRDVAKYRHLDVKEVRKIATGMVYLGSEAKDLGLIDEVGGKRSVVKYLEKNLNTSVSFVEHKEKKSVLDWLQILQSQGLAKADIAQWLFLTQEKVPSFS